MKWLEVRASGPLKGSVRIQGSKNSSLGLLAASCLSDEKVILSNIPFISDTQVVNSILRSIGAVVDFSGHTYTIDPSNISSSIIGPEYSSCIRTAYYFIGALLAKQKKVTVGYPGGDNFHARPIDQHLKGFRALGAKIVLGEKDYTIEAERLTGADINFDVVTTGATINLMMAAVRAKGTSHLYNAATDPEIVDLAVLLNKMGAKVYGAGTNTIRIVGVDSLGGCEHSAIPDRLVAGAFMMAAGVSNGEIKLENVEPEHLTFCIEKLREIGMYIEKGDSTITAASSGRIRAARVRAGKYPMFETDFQQPITSLLLKAKGRSTISDRVFPYRFNHCEQLKRMGADISVKKGISRINSYNRLKGAWVHADDIRAGISLILAGLIAEGTTYITGVEHLERGYEDIEGTFKSLGADISFHSSESSDKPAAVTR